MPDFPISDEAVRAVASWLVANPMPQGATRRYGQTRGFWQEQARAAIEAFLRAEGFEIEQSDAMTLWVPDVKAHRLVSPWRPENA